MSQTEYGKHRGVSQQRVSAMIQRGKLAGCIKKFGKYKKIDRDKADAALEQNLDRIMNKPGREYGENKQVTGKEIKQTTKAAGTTGLSLADAQKIQAQYKAALMKLEYEEKSGKLVEVKAVEQDAFNMARIVRDNILNIPDRISAELASMTDVHLVSEKLVAELTAALEELSK